jgi:hypothetical protein
MKKLVLSRFTLWTIALAALPGSALQAQNITGAWQGTLKAGPQDLRIVIKISLDDDKLKAITYSIDQGAQPIPVSDYERRFDHKDDGRRDQRQL